LLGIALTTNLPFAQWTQVFGDETMTVALLDRPTHRSHVLLPNRRPKAPGTAEKRCGTSRCQFMPDPERRIPQGFAGSSGPTLDGRVTEWQNEAYAY
jgi:hypothetical protein